MAVALCIDPQVTGFKSMKISHLPSTHWKEMWDTDWDLELFRVLIISSHLI
jgi:hypothetical protein